jgi:hypothetical protein
VRSGPGFGVGDADGGSADDDDTGGDTEVAGDAAVVTTGGIGTGDGFVGDVDARPCAVEDATAGVGTDVATARGGSCSDSRCNTGTPGSLAPRA